MSTKLNEKEEIVIVTTTKEEVKENDHATLCEENNPTTKPLEALQTISSLSSPTEKKVYNKKKWWEFWKQDEQLLAINPQDFSKTQKNLILLTIALATLV